MADLDAERIAEQYRLRALEYLNGEDYESAERLLRRCVKLAPSSYSARFTLGILCVIHGDLAEGEALVKQALAFEPPCPVLRSYSDSPCWLEKYYSMSHLMLERALALGIASGTAHYFASLLSFREGEWRQAARQLGNLKTERFPLKDFYLMLAYERLNRGKEAAASYQNFLRRSPVSLQETRLPTSLATDASCASPGAAGGSNNAALNR